VTARVITEAIRAQGSAIMHVDEVARAVRVLADLLAGSDPDFAGELTYEAERLEALLAALRRAP
jgi:hypothetical protein